MAGVARHEDGPGDEGSLRHFVEQVACLSHATGARVELEEEVEVGESGFDTCMDWDWFESSEVVGRDTGLLEERGGWESRGRVGA